MSNVTQSEALLRLCEAIGITPDKIAPETSSDLRQKVETLLQTLSCRERKTIKLLYDLDGITYTHKIIGRILRIIPEKVRALEQSALEKLRRAVRPNLPAP